MKLSEAMMLGSATMKMERGEIQSCAIGAAANALGLIAYDGTRARLVAIFHTWPWLSTNGWVSHDCSRIITLFDHQVCDGEMTFEQLVDYVRSIEPECGECNRFECTCQKQETPQLVREQKRTTAFRLENSDEERWERWHTNTK